MVTPKAVCFLLSFVAFLYLAAQQVEGSTKRHKIKDDTEEDLLSLKRVSYLLHVFSLVLTSFL